MCLISSSHSLFGPYYPGRMSPEIAVNDLHFYWIDRNHPDRSSIEGFISGVFRARFGAEVQYFSDVLIGSRDPDGAWNAAVGLSTITQRAAFLEQYLDDPVEQVIAQLQPQVPHSQSVSRADIVEFGNLAATRPGAVRTLILHLAPFLRARHVRWIVFTGTRSLFNSFAKFDYKPTVIASADPSRLNGGQVLWGTYYDACPEVMFGDVDAAYAHFYA